MTAPRLLPIVGQLVGLRTLTAPAPAAATLVLKPQLQEERRSVRILWLWEPPVASMSLL